MITPIRRDLRFRLPRSVASHWHARGAWVTHFANAMSLTFPEGERYFIHTVRLFREQVRDPHLREAVTAFIGQEAMHSREHEDYNRLLAEAGLPVREIDAALGRFFRLLRTRLPPSMQLSVTIAQEHFTAIIAERLLEDADLLAGADERIAALWRWHALEEIEHKAVAFDVYEAAVGRGASAYALRCASMIATTAGFLAMLVWCQRRLLAADRRPAARAGFTEFVRFLVQPRGGLLPRLAGPWVAYFRPGFHPWQHDNRALLQRHLPPLLAQIRRAPSPSTAKRSAARAARPAAAVGASA